MHSPNSLLQAWLDIKTLASIYSCFLALSLLLVLQIVSSSTGYERNPCLEKFSDRRLTEAVWSDVRKWGKRWTDDSYHSTPSMCQTLLLLYFIYTMFLNNHIKPRTKESESYLTEQSTKIDSHILSHLFWKSKIYVK